MLSVMDAIRNRKSVRKFKPDPVPDEVINQMLEAARLAPSATNRQPWRFQVIKDQALKDKLFAEASFGVEYIKQAPVVIAIGSELLTYVKGHKLSPPNSDYYGSNTENWDELKEYIADAQLNTAIAIEHMALVAAGLGVGTCWVRRLKFGQVGRLLGWPRHIPAFGFLLVGYADGEPQGRPRRTLDEIVIKDGQKLE